MGKYFEWRQVERVVAALRLFSSYSHRQGSLCECVCMCEYVLMSYGNKGNIVKDLKLMLFIYVD